ncbi:hypothetical protein HYPSUDRAFT_218214 [Hypholoma sublateritium FD-334 SS-4]|uniref:NAD(P)-binding protein n=1 Tax=Hypholoma sublateritium (strain FD-334 SS-4) TaxID=945553 RepID=A0A0D2PDV1_HYPSF|nr:hypothetical protein HYPSUDRAFT_218214 [Hypholoma sublateritium FD-334 SS-4]
MTYSDKKVWFVTGTSSGLGRAVVEHILEKGDRVVATLRKPGALADLVPKHSTDQLLVLKLDVVVPSDITAAFAAALAKFGRIDVVYNNAGFTSLGEVEGTQDSIARKMFEVNFFGATNVTREAVRVFRDENKPRGGRLLQASSMAAIQAMAGVGYYSATKFALEGVTQALAAELHPSWGIKITLIELGGFRTSIINEQENLHVAAVHPAYTAADLASVGFRELTTSGKLAESCSDPNKAAREIYKLGLDDNVGFRVPLGLDAIAVVGAQLDETRRDVEAAGKWSVDLK